MGLPAIDRFQYPIDPSRFAWGSPFGVIDQWHKSPHRGTDLKAAPGTPIMAVAAGVVRHVGWSDCLGWNVVIEHGAPHIFSGYDHQLQRPLVKVGQKVVRGQVIGHVGATGSCAAGAHLHFTMGPTVDSNAWGAVINGRDFIESHDTVATKPAVTKRGRRYVAVKHGDTLSSIAAAAHITLSELLALNHDIKDPDLISVGQKVRVH